jgi:glycosyltransferase 2 family protein
VRAEWRTAVRLGIAIVVIGFVARAVSGNWDAIQANAAALQPNWPRMFLGSVCVAAGYAVLIAAWRLLLATWDSPIPVLDAARIWFVSSLGKYVPGKVWSIGAMAVLARDAGASPVAATGSAIIMQLVNLAAGFAVVAVAGAGDLLVAYPALRAGLWFTAFCTAAGLAVGPALLQWAIRTATRILRQPAPVLPAISRLTLVLVFAANVAAWVAYGVGFGLFWEGLLGRGGGVTLAALAVYTASYLLGFLALVVPGGLGVRESALIGLLVSLRLASPADAALLAAGSRVWLTLLEILPGLVFLPGVSLRHRSTSSTPDGPAA